MPVVHFGRLLICAFYCLLYSRDKCTYREIGHTHLMRAGGGVEEFCMACTTLKHASSSTPYFVQPGPSPIASPKAPGQAKISALGMVKVVSADAALSTAVWAM